MGGHTLVLILSQHNVGRNVYTKAALNLFVSKIGAKLPNIVPEGGRMLDKLAADHADLGDSYSSLCGVAEDTACLINELLACVGHCLLDFRRSILEVRVNKSKASSRESIVLVVSFRWIRSSLAMRASTSASWISSGETVPPEYPVVKPCFNTRRFVKDMRCGCFIIAHIA